MDTTRGTEKMITDSVENGFTVDRHEDRIDIYRSHIRTGRVLDGITLWEDGTCTRMGTDLTVCKNIRTLRDRRNVLGLGR